MPRRYYPPRGETYQKYKKPAFRAMEASSGPVRRDEGQVYKSAPITSVQTSLAPERRYTGTFVKGIATMHKSNAVPIIDQSQATEISQMRRS